VRDRRHNASAEAATFSSARHIYVHAA